MIKTSDSNFMRDPNSNSLINIDTTSYKLYKQNRQTAIQNKTLQEEVDALKKDVNEIKNLLGQILSHVSSNS